jgi:protein gp37
MAENTKIEWAHHTFNPWVGCSKVSLGCDHCYAEGWAKRTGSPELWTGERRRTSPANWAKVIKWDRAAEAAGERHRVFCASLADVFDNQAEKTWRDLLWNLIHQTKHLDWLLLTKRPQNIAKMLPPDWGAGWPNVWLGTTVENQAEADRRIPHLLAVAAVVHFLSCEPLLGPVDLNRDIGGTRWMGGQRGCAGFHHHSGRVGQVMHGVRHDRDPTSSHHHHDDRCRPGVDWVIVGGESGPAARPMHPDWARSIRKQCGAVNVPFFFKQWGDWRPVGRLFDRAGDTDETEAAADALIAATSLRPPYETNENKARLIDDDGMNWANEACQPPPDCIVVERVSKAKAGRFFDGRIWNDMPLLASSTPETVK